jgi:predicted neuraminidase
MDGYQSRARRVLIPVLMLTAFGAAFLKAERRPPPSLFQFGSGHDNGARQDLGASGLATAAVGMRTHFVSRQKDISAHAASIVELGDARIRAFWFAGSREGAPDVEIRSSVFDPDTASWGPEVAVVTREATQHALYRYVKKLGNPVVQRTPDGTLWLYYVTVSLGGWAGSSLTMMTSKDDGASWTPPRRIITSPFLNISTLVKGTPFLYVDGTLGVPVYHEFIGKFGELLRLSDTGDVIDKQRLSSGRTSLQPVVLIQDHTRALALMRRSGSSAKRVIETLTADAGQRWSTPVKTSLANPDAAITGVVLPDGRILLALNNLEYGRDALSLVVSQDGGTSWQTVYQLEDGRRPTAGVAGYLQSAAEMARNTQAGIEDAMSYARSAQRNKCEGGSCAFEFSYPYMLLSTNGVIHLVYTWNRSFIKHVEFTQPWLDNQMKGIRNAATR